MKKSIEIWKKGEAGMNKNNPVVINKDVMKNVVGGLEKSAGRFCTISAETTGTSCNTVGGVFDQITVWLLP